jgi:hypothetical protein
MWAGGRDRGFPCRDSPEGSATTFSIGEEVGRNRASRPAFVQLLRLQRVTTRAPLRGGAFAQFGQAESRGYGLFPFCYGRSGIG